MAGNPSQLSVAPQPNGTKQSAPQKRFNSLLKKIDTHRKTLEAWNAAEPVYINLFADQFEPIRKQIENQHLTLVRILDSASKRFKFGKQDAKTLTFVICEIAETLLARRRENEAELKDIFARHAGVDFDTVQQQEIAQFKAHMAQEFDVELDGVENLKSEEEIAEFLFDKMLNSDDAPHGQAGPVKKSARQKRQEEELARSSQSMREIYRKLASALHPDRETDEAERSRKTDLMQRVNSAYAAKDLLALLHLQLEIEQIDQDHVSNLPQERIKHYNRVLAEQVMELEDEINARNISFNALFVLDPFTNTKPKNIPRTCEKQLDDFRLTLHHMAREQESLQHSKNIRPWLRAQREILEDDLAEQEMLNELFR